MEELLSLTDSAPLPLDALVINLILGIILGAFVGWYYSRFGRSMSNRSRLAHILPVLAVTTVLIISVVKSSLALSLGLVGALSIVRFRTAIKEPEELNYLFIAIAIGIGLGADQRLATVVAIFLILAYLFARRLMDPRQPKNNLFLNISTADEKGTFGLINKMLEQHSEAADLRRLDRIDNKLQATYLIKCQDSTALTALMDAFDEQLSGAEFSFVEQDSSLSG